METKRIGITSRIAICHDCRWRCEVQGKSAYGNAKFHAKSKKHKVSIESASVIYYNGRLKNKK